MDQPLIQQDPHIRHHRPEGGLGPIPLQADLVEGGGRAVGVADERHQDRVVACREQLGDGGARVPEARQGAGLVLHPRGVGRGLAHPGPPLDRAPHPSVPRADAVAVGVDQGSTLAVDRVVGQLAEPPGSVHLGGDQPALQIVASAAGVDVRFLSTPDREQQIDQGSVLEPGAQGTHQPPGLVAAGGVGGLPEGDAFFEHGFHPGSAGRGPAWSADGRPHAEGGRPTWRSTGHGTSWVVARGRGSPST